MSGEMTIYTLTEARVSRVRCEQDTVILTMRSGQHQMHYEMNLASLEGLAKRLRADVKLIKAVTPGRLS